MNGTAANPRSLSGKLLRYSLVTLILLSVYYAVLTGTLLRGPLTGFLASMIFIGIAIFVIPILLSVICAYFFLRHAVYSNLTRLIAVVLVLALPVLAIVAHLLVRCFVLIQCA